MNKLYIDTRNNIRVSARLDCDGNIFESYSENDNRHPDSIINLIDDVLNKANIELRQVDKIYVEEGPGSFTGLKVGTSVANTLGVFLQKRINDKKIGELIEPKYE